MFDLSRPYDVLGGGGGNAGLCTVFGGFTLAICTYLIEATGNPAAPAVWLSAAALVSLVAVFASRRLANEFAGERMLQRAGPFSVAAGG